MDRYAIFLDAGYFFSAGAHLITGSTTPRKLVTLKAAGAAVEALCAAAALQVSGVQLLRAYWYDAMPGQRVSLEQSTLAMLPFVKLRLGVLNNVGEQKGVDSLIVTDLIELARNRAISDAVIVSGDEDLRIAVHVAQSFGVRVHILAAGDPRTNVSASLQMESDSVGALPLSWFSQHLLITKPPLIPVAIAAVAATAAPASSGTAAVTSPGAIGLGSSARTLEDVAGIVCTEILSTTSPTQTDSLKQHFVGSNSVPPEYDGRLIAKTAAKRGGEKLTSGEMRRVRGVFVNAVRALK